MLKKMNIFTLLAIFTVASGISLAQVNSPMPRIERNVQIISNDGSYLGVQTEDVTKQNFSKYGLSEVRGVVIVKVSENSPAKQAGLQDGDVIVKFNGEDVTSVRKLTRLIDEVAPDHQAKVVVWRNGGEKELSATIGKRPLSGLGAIELARFPNSQGSWTMSIPPGRFPNSDESVENMRILPQGQMPREGEFGLYPPTFNGDTLVWTGKLGGTLIAGANQRIGIKTMPLSKQLGDYFGVNNSGVLVSDVAENSPAAQAGLKAGDVIIEIEGKSLTNSMDLTNAVNNKGEGEIALTIVRERKQQTVKVKIEKQVSSYSNLIEQQQKFDELQRQKYKQMEEKLKQAEEKLKNAEEKLKQQKPNQ